MADLKAELLQRTQRLLDCIAHGDWETYAELCDPSLTAIEPEAPGGQVVEGLDFHRYYFNLGGIRGPHQTTLCAPHVRIMGDVAVVAYVRLVQRLGLDNGPTTVATAETRVWQLRDGRWLHVHFHRSPLKT
jgi:Calcium/calmodulin dependent protein kinase II association domain